MSLNYVNGACTCINCHAYKKQHFKVYIRVVENSNLLNNQTFTLNSYTCNVIHLLLSINLKEIKECPISG